MNAIHVPTVPIPIQLPPNMFGKAVVENTGVWVPATHTGEREEAAVPGFGLARPGHCWSHLGSELALCIYVFVPLFI